MQASKRLLSTSTRRILVNKKYVEKQVKQLIIEKIDTIDMFLISGAAVGVVAGTLSIDKYDGIVIAMIQPVFGAMFGGLGGLIIGASLPALPYIGTLMTIGVIKYTFTN